jgi:hypothetical protein
MDDDSRNCSRHAASDTGAAKSIGDAPEQEA